MGLHAFVRRVLGEGAGWRSVCVWEWKGTRGKRPSRKLGSTVSWARRGRRASLGCLRCWPAWVGRWGLVSWA